MTARYRLPNGLTVLLEENHAAPVVAFQAWVNVGSADEPEELAGIAHVFEHMLFKGTARRGVGRIAQEIEAAGGDINAWTSFDQTVFHLVLASRYFDTGLDIISDALQNSSFDPEELARELKVVLEEVKQGEDSPSRVASQQLFATAYGRHPYRRPVIGYSRTVERFRREALIEFFGRHYVPANITLVVVGDFDAARAREKIAAAWNGTRATEAPPRERPAEPEQRGPRMVVTGADVREAHLAVAFHIPGIQHADTGAIDLAAIVLGQGDSSRLQLEVKRNRQLVSDVYAYSYTPKDPGLLVAGATLPPERADAALDALLEQVFLLGHAEALPEELEKAKTIVESDAVYQKETVQGTARKLGFFETVTGSLAYEAEYGRQVREVTPRGMREAAARYLRPDNCTIALLLPQADLAAGKKKVEARVGQRLAAAWERSERARRKLPRAPEAGEVLREVLPNGARVLVLRDPSIPLMAMRAVWSGGLRFEDEKNNGINNLIASLVTRGTRTRSGDELAREIESMAGSIGGFSGRNSFGLRAEVLARHADRALALFADCILHPAFAEAELEKERRLVLEELRAQEDNVSSVAFRLFTEALYRRHPYRMDALGTPASIAGLTRRRIADYYRRRADPSGMTLAIVGDVDPARVLAQARQLFDVPPGPAAVDRPPGPEPPPTAPTQVWKLLPKQQAHLVLGFPGTTVAHPDRFPLEVLATILSGQGGRLFVELRDKRGLAYRVSAFSLEGVDPGYFAVYLATSPENLAVAEAGIRDELHKVIDRPVPRDELERAKRYLVGAHDISLQRRAALASTLAFHECYGLGWDEYRRYAPGILAVTAADVQRVARQYLDPERAVLAVVKPEEVSPAIARKRAREAEAAARAARAQPPPRASSKPSKGRKP